MTGEVRITISGAEVLTTRDRRSNEVVALPAAIAEIRTDGPDAVPLPTEVDLGCREVLRIDGAPATFDLGTVRIADVLAGEPIVSHPCQGGGGEITVWGAARHDPDREPAGRRDRTRRRPRRAARSSRCGDRCRRVDVDVLDQARTSRTVHVAPCSIGCWVVLGEGFNDGWVAEIDGTMTSTASISAPDSSWTAGSTAGTCSPSDAPRTVTFRWTPQRAVTIGLWLSGLAVIACVVLAVADRRRRPIEAARSPRLVGFGRELAASRRQLWAGPIVATAVAFVLCGPGWSLVALALGVVAVALGRPRLLGAFALAIWLWCGAVVLWRVVRYRPFPNAGWPGTFEDLHRPGMLVLALLAGSLATERPRRQIEPFPGSSLSRP